MSIVTYESRLGVLPAPGDLLVYGEAGQLVVEVKSGRAGHLPKKVVDRWFEQMLETQDVNRSQGLAIVDPWRIYLYLPPATFHATDRLEADSAKSDKYSFDVEASLAAFIDTNRLPLPSLRHDDLLQVVASWLAFTLNATARQLLSRPADAWMVQTGLHQALTNATMEWRHAIR